MFDLIKRNRLFLSALTVLVMLALLLSARWRAPGAMGWLDELAQTIAYPFQAGYHSVSTSLRNTLSDYVSLVNLRQENDRLKLQVQALQEEVNHYINSAIQFNLLREQMLFLEEQPDRKVFAEVIGESVDNFHNVLLINKGRNVGIRRNFPVVLREGVVGRIQSTTATESVVQLIIDRRHRFPVLVQRSRQRLELQGQGGSVRLQPNDRGVVLGTGETLRMERIRMLADVEPEDRIVTSGMAGIFPKGLLVGVVKNVTRERHELFQSAEVVPAVDFNRIEGVFVILKEPKSADYPLFSE
ncbi:MAG: rod shape-determining protein MreC [Deltaproteobacteria bacterium]|nr:rod shape-determining protein MreC [Deltaproteobacteria bacterium]